MNSVGPISVIGTQGVGQAESMGSIRSFQWEQNVPKGNSEFALETWWDQSLISIGPKCYEGKQRVCNAISVRPRSLSMRPKRLGFLAVAMSSELGGAG